MAAPTKQLLVLVGLPFSGKTTYAQSLHPEQAEIISRDAILESINANESLRRSLFERSQEQKKSWNDVVTEEYVRQVTKKIQDSAASTIIIDGTHLGTASRSFISSFSEYQPTAVIFQTSLEICLKRREQVHLSGIRSTVTPELIHNLQKLYIPPTREEGFFEIRFAESQG